MPQQTADLDQLFRALADPTRRAVVERLGHGPASTSELASGIEMALPSFMQHLHVLDDVGLVTSRKQGRVRIYELTPEPLGAAESWMISQRRLWERRLDQFDAYVTTMREEQP